MSKTVFSKRPVEQEGTKPIVGRATMLTYNGVTGSIRWWANELGMVPSTLYRRLVKSKWDLEAACSKSVREKPKGGVTYQGETHSVREWAKILGIPSGTLQSRLYNGWSIEQAFNSPLDASKQRVHSLRKNAKRSK